MITLFFAHFLLYMAEMYCRKVKLKITNIQQTLFLQFLSNAKYTMEHFRIFKRDGTRTLNFLQGGRSRDRGGRRKGLSSLP